MGTSKPNSLGGSPRWSGPRDELRDLAGEVIRPPAKQSAGGAVSLGNSLLKAQSADPRFLPLLEDCSIKVALRGLLALAEAVIVRRLSISALLKEYGIETVAESPGFALSKALDDGFIERLIQECAGKITDSDEKVRIAMLHAFVEMVTGEKAAQSLLKVTANEIHNALRQQNSLAIAGIFYSNYLATVLKFLVASSEAGLAPAAEQHINERLRRDYCDLIARKLVNRARSKGWNASSIPDRVSEWQDLLEGEQMHV
jgi:hypothetical protein